MAPDDSGRAGVHSQGESAGSAASSYGVGHEHPRSGLPIVGQAQHPSTDTSAATNNRTSNTKARDASGESTLHGSWRAIEVWHAGVRYSEPLAPTNMNFRPDGHGDVAVGNVRARLDLEYKASEATIGWRGLGAGAIVGGVGSARLDEHGSLEVRLLDRTRHEIVLRGRRDADLGTWLSEQVSPLQLSPEQIASLHAYTRRLEVAERLEPPSGAAARMRRVFLNELAPLGLGWAGAMRPHGPTPVEEQGEILGLLTGETELTNNVYIDYLEARDITRDPTIRIAKERLGRPQRWPIPKFKGWMDKLPDALKKDEDAYWNRLTEVEKTFEQEYFGKGLLSGFTVQVPDMLTRSRRQVFFGFQDISGKGWLEWIAHFAQIGNYVSAIASAYHNKASRYMEYFVDAAFLSEDTKQRMILQNEKLLSQLKDSGRIESQFTNHYLYSLARVPPSRLNDEPKPEQRFELSVNMRSAVRLLTEQLPDFRGPLSPDDAEALRQARDAINLTLGEQAASEASLTDDLGIPLSPLEAEVVAMVERAKQGHPPQTPYHRDEWESPVEFVRKVYGRYLTSCGAESDAIYQDQIRKIHPNPGDLQKLAHSMSRYELLSVYGTPEWGHGLDTDIRNYLSRGGRGGKSAYDQLIPLKSARRAKVAQIVASGATEVMAAARRASNYAAKVYGIRAKSKV